MNDAVVRMSLSFSFPPLEAGEFSIGEILPAVLVQLATPAPSALSGMPVNFFPLIFLS